MKDPDRRAAILNSDLEKINSLAKRWKVSFNEEKTELLIFKKDNHPVYPLSFGNSVLEDKECHKHLGLIFQSNCKWEKHINSIIRKVTLLVSCLRSFKYKLCRKALDTMYKSFIIIIVLMYIYHALINALSAHMIHINRNMIFYTHVEHSPTKISYIKYYIHI